MMILLNVGIVVLCSLIIMYACDTFDLASREIGSSFPQGIRGATINAIGSSLPELFTTFFLLFVYHDQDGFSGGIATCAGSAIFNAVVIPGMCIMAVLIWGVTRGSRKEKVEAIQLQRRGVVRDGIFFLGCCVLLVFMLSGKVLHWWMGALLVVIYTIYIGVIYIEVKRGKIEADEEEDEKEEEEEEGETPPIWQSILTLDVNQLLYKGAAINRSRAWVLLMISVALIALPCHFLAGACVNIAKLTGVPVFFTAVILAAAATSVPDTIISIKDALQGDYDDAVSNAFGSNIFDITICLGLPLLLYGVFFGEVKLAGAASAGSAGGAAVQELQLILLFITLCVMAIFLSGRKLGMVRASMLFSLYGLFLLYCAGRVYQWPWAQTIASWLTFSM